MFMVHFSQDALENWTYVNALWTSSENNVVMLAPLSTLCFSQGML